MIASPPAFPRQSIALRDGARFAYRSSLAAPAPAEHAPLLLLHGFTGTAQTHMAPLLAAFAQRRLVAPDLRGYGASQPPARDCPPLFYTRDADDVAALLDHLRSEKALAADERAIVLGFSDGAESALLLAARRPDLVRGVVAWGVCGVSSAALVDSVPAWLPADPARPYWRDKQAAWRDEMVAQHGAAQFTPMIEGWVRAAEAIHAAGGNICLHEAARVECPVLLLNGAGEVGNPPADVQALAARIPHGRLEFVAESGHAIHEDQPETFLLLVRNFLAAVEQSEP